MKRLGAAAVADSAATKMSRWFKSNSRFRTISPEPAASQTSSYNANPGTGYAIYDSIGINGARAGFKSAVPAPPRRNGRLWSRSQTPSALPPARQISPARTERSTRSAKTHHRHTFHAVTNAGQWLLRASLRCSRRIRLRDRPWHAAIQSLGSSPGLSPVKFPRKQHRVPAPPLLALRPPRWTEGSRGRIQTEPSD